MSDGRTCRGEVVDDYGTSYQHQHSIDDEWHSLFLSSTTAAALAAIANTTRKQKTTAAGNLENIAEKERGQRKET